jgi:hypothetical protein
MKTNVKLFFLLAPVLITSLVCGSSPWSRWKKMAPQSVSLANRYDGSVSVEIDASQIWHGASKAFVRYEGVTEHLDEFHNAVADTITKHQIFTSVQPPSQADWNLIVRFTDASDLPGLPEATLDTTWELSSRRGGEKVWVQNVHGTSTASPIVEGGPREPSVRSAQNTIKIALEALSRAQFRSPGSPRPSVDDDVTPPSRRQGAG